jgi:GDPmannose 4,6-dehydratase
VPRALITGISGQDGSYLAEHLLNLGYEVHGLVRRTSGGTLWRLEGLEPRITLHPGDLLDSGSLTRAVERANPDEIYHLAAQSFVGRSWDEPVHTAEVTGLGTLRLLEVVRQLAPKARFYQASTSEMFGNAGSGQRRSSGPFHPRSPYATAKKFAHDTAVLWRESFGLYVSCGILFNHESPRRGPEFVTRKVAIGAARAARGDRTPLRLGDLNARRDWGWAPEYVVAMHRMLQGDAPVDAVVATGESHSVRDLCAEAFGAVNLDWRDHVVVDEALCRPAEVHDLVGDPSEAAALGWVASVRFPELVRRMVEAELTP